MSELFLTLLAFFLLAVGIGLPVWIVVSLRNLRRDHDRLADEVERLERKLREGQSGPGPNPTAGRAEDALGSQPTREASAVAKAMADKSAGTATRVTAAEPSAPIPAWNEPPEWPAPRHQAAVPPTLPPPLPPFSPPAAVPARGPAINWELFMGVKLFAWLGGLAFFLGVVYFLKYSIDHNWIPPELRAAIGFIAGAGLLVAGLRLARRYAVTGQTLCATGIVVLYAVTFACRAHYHFEFFSVWATFALMVLITATAFLLAVRLEARVVAVLGMLGGFLTPVLLATGQDNPVGLFGYLALLDAGLIAVALHRRWDFLVPLGAGGTVLMELGWTDRFFAPEKFSTAILINLVFIGLFLLAAVVARVRRQATMPLFATAAALPFVAFAFAGYFLGFPGLAARPGLLFTFVLLADAAVLTLAWLEAEAARVHTLAGAAVFLLLAVWTGASLTPELLPWGLALYLAFAALHTAGPPLLARRHAVAAAAGDQLWPAVTLLLLLLTLSRLPVVPLLVWPAVLLLDLLAIGLALLTASLAGLAAVLVLTLVATGAWILKIPADNSAPTALLLVIGGFAVLFFFAGQWLVRRLGDRLESDASGPGRFTLPGDGRGQIPSVAVLLPFALLVMVVTRLALPDPSPVFGLALLLVGLALGLTRLMVIEWLPAAALTGTLALEYAWQGSRFQPDHGPVALAWYLLFYAVFAVFPFVFRKAFSDARGPWIVAALSGPLHFALLHRLIGATWPNHHVMGLLPAAFVLPALAGLVAVRRGLPEEHPQKLGRLAWFGGVALFFITLVFPVQFDRQWITLGWAVEGAALLWLFHRLPHPGLRLAGLGLLMAAFVRLGLNPAVLGYHPRTAPIFNWYLYTYGVTAAALFTGARLLAPPRDRVLGYVAPPWLNGLGVVLAFQLLNLEIADYFSPAEGNLAFEFSGNLARDMTYTIAWALFAFGLLVAGIWRRQVAARYAGLGLLSVALLKLFFRDLANLDNLYRIVALIAVAIIAILASFVYQRFLPTAHDAAPPPPPPPGPA